MKGVVFTEFLEMVEENSGADAADEIIDKAKLPNEGAYTAVGMQRENIEGRGGLQANFRITTKVPTSV